MFNSSFIRTAFVISLGLAALAAPRPTEAQQGAGADFAQLNWLSNAGTPLVPASRVVSVELTFSAQAAQLLQQNGGGYVNLVTDTGMGPRWSIENLYLVYPDLNYMLVSHPTVQFDAGIADGTTLVQLQWSLTITPQPLAAPQQQPPQMALVGQSDYLVGGVDGGGSGQLELVERSSTFVGCHFAECAQPLFAALLPTPVATSIAEVDEGTMGCVPGGLARSLKYLFGGDELAGVDVQAIYAALYGLLGTNATTGTQHDRIKKAKRDYAKQNGLGIDTHDYNFKNGVRFGSDGLSGGADVEMRIQWPNGQGHFVMVTSIVSLGKDKGYQIKYVDDPAQGDGKAANQEHTVNVDKDGNLRPPGTGKVTNFLVESKKKK